MNRKWRPAAIAIVFALSILVTGCGGGAPQSEENAESQPEAIMAVTAAPVRVIAMRQELRLLGTTVAMRHITLRAPSAGRVTGLNLQEGDRVSAGEVVGQVVNREIEAAEQGLEVARRIDPDEAAAMAGTLKHYGGGTGIAITAPENAVVSQRIVSSGQMVTDLEALADLIDPKSIYVQAAVPVDEIAQVRPGMTALVTSPLQPAVEFPARVAALSPNFTQGAAAVSTARLEFTSARKIGQAGAPVEIQLITKSAPQAVAIPAAALFEDAANDTFYVFVAGPDGKAHRTSVRLGIRNPEEVQITSGLAPGQFVITSGGYALSDGLKVKVTVPQT
jgi:multidrug efflux pump subunit AcrA (membrane-fusion protein)